MITNTYAIAHILGIVRDLVAVSRFPGALWRMSTEFSAATVDDMPLAKKDSLRQTAPPPDAPALATRFPLAMSLAMRGLMANHGAHFARSDKAAARPATKHL